MTGIAIEILAILALVIANGVFSGSEIAVISSRKIRLDQMAQDGNQSAKKALALATSPNDFLSTVQIGITLIGILSGTVAGATFVSRLNQLLSQVPFLDTYSDGISVGLVVGIITYLSLVVGELVPKRIALNNPELIACWVAKPMGWLSWITAPLVNLLTASTEGLLRLLRIKPTDEPTITEEEIKLAIRQAGTTGILAHSEQAMLERIFLLGDRSVKSLMTPRREICWLDIEASPEDTLKVVSNTAYTRFPVARGDLDQCLGVIKGSTILTAQLRNHPLEWEALIQSPLFISENTFALKVLEQFKQTGIHLALVVDEYGGIEGLVTLNNVMEAIVGDLPSLEDQEQPLFVQREDGSWLLEGSLHIEEFRTVFHIEGFEEEKEVGYHTLAGFIIHQLGHIPEAGEHFEWHGFRFEVVDMDGMRVDKILAMRKP
ncbi:MAG: hemolysin family protein [Cyanophyceae cyanobacterium]